MEADTLKTSFESFEIQEAGLSQGGAEYDIFFSYNSRDRERVEEVARSLRKRDPGLKVFLDRWYLRPGLPWPAALEKTLRSCRAIAVFLGPHQLGAWQQRERDFALERQGKEAGLPVIPVLLPGAKPEISFLSSFTWIDLRQGVLDAVALEALALAIEGKPPGPDLLVTVQRLKSSIRPYQGLFPFREEDAPLFFGRETITEHLVTTVRHQHLTALVAPSGQGKSSLVRAGVIPLLRKNDDGAVWEAVSFRPTNHPLHELAKALLSLLDPEISAGRLIKEAGDLADGMLQGNVYLSTLVQSVLDKQHGTDRLLLVVDQWEELYTQAEKDERNRFIDQILDASRGGELSVLLTLRADFYDRLLRNKELSQRLQGHVVHLENMSRDELRQAIEKPAQAVGWEIDPGLVASILEELDEEPGNLPLLEVLLDELWNTWRIGDSPEESYEDMGRLRGTLAARADRIIKEKNLQQTEVQRLFLRLVAIGKNTPETRRRATYGELEASTLELVQPLVDARLLVVAQDAMGETTVEVAHEALIRHWETLQTWLQEFQDFLTWRTRIQTDAEEWKAKGKRRDLLLPRGRLESAEDWRNRKAEYLSALEREYIDRSLDKAKVRRRALKGAVVLVVLTAVVFAILAAYAFRQREAYKAQYKLSLSQALAARALVYQQGPLDLALLLSVEAARVENSLEARSSLLNLVEAGRLIAAFLHEPSGTLYQIAVTPDRKRFATGGSKDILIWNASTPIPRLWKRINAHEGQITSLAFDPTGTTLVSSAEGDKNLRFWNVESGGTAGVIPWPQGAVWNLRYSPDGRYLVSNRGKRIFLLNIRELGQPAKLDGHQSWVSGLAFSPKGDRLASSSDDKTILLWDLNRGQPLGPALLGHEQQVLCLAFSPDGRVLASGSADRKVLVWDVVARRLLGARQAHRDYVLSVAFSPDGSRLASASRDRRILIWANGPRGWGEASEEPVMELIGQGQAVQSLAFLDHRRLISGGDEGSLLVWDLQRLPLYEQSLAGSQGEIYALTFEPEGRALAAGGKNGQITVWDLKTERTAPPFSLTKHKSPIVGLAFRQDGEVLASVDSTRRVLLWDLKKRKVLADLAAPAGERIEALSLAFSPDGKVVAVGDSARNIHLRFLDERGDKLLKTDGAVYSLAFSPDTTRLIAGAGQRIYLWKLDHLKEPYDALKGHGEELSGLSVSRNGQVLTSGSTDRTVRIWDLTRASPPGHRLTGPDDSVTSVADDPSERFVAAGVLDGTVFLWDRESRRPIGSGWGRDGKVYAVAFDPNGACLASAHDDGVRLWDVRYDVWREEACRIAGRNLTQEEWSEYLPREDYRATCPEFARNEKTQNES